MTCDAACLAEAGVPSASAVRDVWRHADLDPRRPLAARVAADGGSAVFVVTVRRPHRPAIRNG